jgi:GSCFA family protein
MARGETLQSDIGELVSPLAKGHVPKREWYSRGAKPYPLDNGLFYGDLRRLLDRYVLPGHTPREPFLEATNTVITLGSCFANQLRTYLRQAGFASDRIVIPSGLNNTYAMLDFISWVVTGSETGRGFRYDTTSQGEIAEWKPEQERAHMLDCLRGAGAFVFTLGLAEIWEDPETGGVFWRGVPKDVYRSDRHVFRRSTVGENEQNLLQIVELIRQVNTTAAIVLTLSPVPLNATFRDISCVTADCVSKSTLRVAIDSVLEKNLEGVYYWPSFEVVRWVGPHLPWPAYGFDNAGNSRHPTRYLVALIMDAFIESFFTPAAVSELRAKTGSLGATDRPPSWLQEFAGLAADWTEGQLDGKSRSRLRLWDMLRSRRRNHARVGAGSRGD